MSKSAEERFARGRNLKPERKIAQAAADFYLLEHLAYVRHDPWAAGRLAAHEGALAKEFAVYLDVAIGGELRYARYLDGWPCELEPFFRETLRGSRGTAWLVWSVIRRKLGLQALELAEETFSLDGWRGNYGGEAWAYVARALLGYLQGFRKPRVFVDQCFNLEHNSGSIFNKLYDVDNLPQVLQAHGSGDYPTLLAAASADVRSRWRMHEWRVRVDRDPIWLGVQILDETFENVA